MRYLVSLFVLGFAPFVAPSAEAQTVAVVGVYSAGWNMVGGPAGTAFAGATDLDLYANNTYTSASANVGDPCSGMWARFTDPTVVPLPTSTGPTAACPLAAGWNLVGNPFSGDAILPQGVIAYHWNPDRTRYDIVSAIPPGASVWIESSGAAEIVLTFSPVFQPRVPVLYINSFPADPGPYTLHVGDSLKLLIPLSNPYDIVVDPRLLTLQASGETGPMSCMGSCVINLLDQFYTYRAIAPGSTNLSFTPRCISRTPPCTESSAVITVTIDP